MALFQCHVYAEAHGQQAMMNVGAVDGRIRRALDGLVLS